jgi:RNA-binding protein YlmH
MFRKNSSTISAYFPFASLLGNRLFASASFAFALFGAKLCFTLAVSSLIQIIRLLKRGRIPRFLFEIKMQNKEWYLRRFGPSPNLDKYIGWYKEALYQQTQILTGFLNPHELALLKAVLGNEVPLISSGGFANSEKQRAIINPQGSIDFRLALLQFDYNQRFNQLTHSQILGVLTHLGVELDTFGDIVTDGNGCWQVIVQKELAAFFCQQIQRVGRASVKVQLVSWQDLVDQSDDHLEASAVANSLRLDAVLAKIGKQSRKEVQTAITAGEVQVDFMLPQRLETAVEPGQIISWRHFGRIKLLSAQPTRKGRYRLEYYLWASHH